MVVYLPGLDHFLHWAGVNNDQYGGNVSEWYFANVLNPRLQRIRDAANPWNESTVYAVYSDHGHFDTLPDRSIELEHQGSAMIPAPTMKATLQAGKTIHVGDHYVSSADSASPPNVIFVPQFGLANIYVANNVLTTQVPYWTKPASTSNLEPIVNSLYYTYMSGRAWSEKPIADILVRVPGNDGGFDGSRYKVVPRNYDKNRSDCGPQHTQHCSLQDQLLETSMLDGLGIGSEFDEATSDWLYASPEERLRDSISMNSGDIVLLANGRWEYQFGEPDKAQHGSLTLKDAQVPLAFAYPAAVGDGTQNNLLAPLSDFLAGLPAGLVPACSGPLEQRRCNEEQALERFFFRQ